MSVSVVLVASSTRVVGLVLQYVLLYDGPVPRQLLQYVQTA